MTRAVCTMIFLLLFLPLAVVRGRVDLRRKQGPCDPYVEYSCACDATDSAKPVLINMCKTATFRMPLCEPCARPLQDYIRCSECPGSVCPVCTPNIRPTSGDPSWRKQLPRFTFLPGKGKVMYLPEQTDENIRGTIGGYPLNSKKEYSVEKRPPPAGSWKQKDSTALRQNLGKLSELVPGAFGDEQIAPKPSSVLTKPKEMNFQNGIVSDLNETVAEIVEYKQNDSDTRDRWFNLNDIERNGSGQNNHTSGIFDATLVDFKPVDNLTKAVESVDTIEWKEWKMETFKNISTISMSTFSIHTIPVEPVWRSRVLLGQNINQPNGSGEIEFSGGNSFALNPDADRMESIAKDWNANSMKETDKSNFSSSTNENLRNGLKILGMALNEENESGLLNSVNEMQFHSLSKNYHTNVHCNKLPLTIHYVSKDSMRNKGESEGRKEPELKFSNKFKSSPLSSNASNSLDDNQSKVLNITLNICSNQFENFLVNNNFIRNKRELQEGSQCFFNKTQESVISDLGAVYEFRCTINTGEIFSSLKFKKPFFVMKYSEKYKTNFFKIDLNILILDIKNCFSTDKLIIYSNGTKIDISNCNFTCLSDLVNAHAVKAIEISKTFGAASSIEFKMFENLADNIYLDIAMVMEFSEDNFTNKPFEDSLLGDSADSSFPVGGLLKLKMTLFFGNKSSAVDAKVKETLRSDQVKDVRRIFLEDLIRFDEGGKYTNLENLSHNSDGVSSKKPSYYRNKEENSNHLFRVLVFPKTRGIANRPNGGESCFESCRLCEVWSASSALFRMHSSFLGTRSSIFEHPRINCRIMKNLKNRFGCKCSILPKAAYETKKEYPRPDARPDVTSVFLLPKMQNSKFQKWQLETNPDDLKLSSYFDRIRTEVIHDIEKEYFRNRGSIGNLSTKFLNRFSSPPENRKRSIREDVGFGNITGEICFKNINFDTWIEDHLSDGSDTSDQFIDQLRFNPPKLHPEQMKNSPALDGTNGNHKSRKLREADGLLNDKHETFFHFLDLDADSLNIEEDNEEYAEEVFNRFGMGASSDSMKVCLKGGDGDNTEKESGILFFRISSTTKPGIWLSTKDETKEKFENKSELVHELENIMKSFVDEFEILLLSPHTKLDDQTEVEESDESGVTLKDTVNYANKSMSPGNRTFIRLVLDTVRGKLSKKVVEVDELKETVKFFGEELLSDGYADYLIDNLESTANLLRDLWIFEPLVNASENDFPSEVDGATTAYVSEERANFSVSDGEEAGDPNYASPIGETKAKSASNEGTDEVEGRSTLRHSDKAPSGIGGGEVGLVMREDLHRSPNKSEIEDFMRGIDGLTRSRRRRFLNEFSTCMQNAANIRVCVDSLMENIGGHLGPLWKGGESDVIPDNDWCELPVITRNGNLDCKFWPDKKECTLHCHENFSVFGKKSATMTCHQGDVWEPRQLVCERQRRQPRPPRPEPLPPPPNDDDFPPLPRPFPRPRPRPHPGPRPKPRPRPFPGPRPRPFPRPRPRPFPRPRPEPETVTMVFEQAGDCDHPWSEDDIYNGQEYIP